MPVDQDKVEQQLAKMVENLKPFVEGSEPNNILARMQSRVIPELVRWKCGEMNRGSCQNAVLNAFVAMVSSQMSSMICEITGGRPGDDDSDNYTLANTILMAIGQEVGTILSGEREMQDYNVPAERAH